MFRTCGADWRGMRSRFRPTCSLRPSPISMRGYSREPVDAHIERLNRVIAELEMNRSPRSAVRNALDRVGEQTAGILRQARRAAEEILGSANEEADEITSRAAAAARELIVDASDDADRSRAEAAELVRGAREEAEGLLAQAREDAARMASKPSRRPITCAGTWMRSWRHGALRPRRGCSRCVPIRCRVGGATRPARGDPGIRSPGPRARQRGGSAIARPDGRRGDGRGEGGISAPRWRRPGRGDRSEARPGGRWRRRRQWDPACRHVAANPPTQD